MFGPKRFTDLAAGLPGAGPTILAQRLRELEATGVVRRRRLPPPAGLQVYELTEWGAELDPIVAALGRWGRASPIVAAEGVRGADPAILMLRTFFEAQTERTWNATYEIRLGGNSFTSGSRRVGSSTSDAGSPPGPRTPPSKPTRRRSPDFSHGSRRSTAPSRAAI